MNYYIDTEFLEGSQKENFPISLFRKETPNTIDLISIGIISEDGREYYAISKDFNLKEAWNRYDITEQTSFEKYNGFSGKKVYWIRENVLKPIFYEWHGKDINFHDIDRYFTYKEFKRLLKRRGKTNIQIANEICSYIYGGEDDISGLSPLQLAQQYEINDKSLEPKFYAYYADYDWVVFCWLFGRMIDLPNGFPMYCNDLKQLLDEKLLSTDSIGLYDIKNKMTLKQKLIFVKNNPNYPKQENEHNALADARWNKKLHEFINTL